MSRTTLKRFAVHTLLMALVGMLVLVGLSFHIQHKTKEFIYEDAGKIPEAYTVIVLGASVKRDGELSVVLRDRVESALFLYENNKVKRFLLSGDNGSQYYNEPSAMKKYLLERGVPEEDIFMDFAGFDTYDSVFRANYIFEVDRAIVVSQRFHLPRAIYLARSMGLDFYGYIGDRRKYEADVKNNFRELIANVKALGELLVNKDPHFKGKKIPITEKATL